MGYDVEMEGEHGEEPAGEAGQQQKTPAGRERVNLFTVSALRLHLPRGGMPPTPGTEPPLMSRLLGRAGALVRRLQAMARLGRR